MNKSVFFVLFTGNFLSLIAMKRSPAEESSIQQAKESRISIPAAAEEVSSQQYAAQELRNWEMKMRLLS